MELTVIGVFDDATEAKVAVDKLVAAGVARNNIDMSAHTAQADTYEDDYEDSGVVEFFKNLFGDDDDDRRKYSTVGSRGSIVTVHTTNESQAEKAADILDDNGALNVHDRAAKYNTDTNTAAKAAGTVAGKENIKIIEENLQVGKKSVQTGGVRLKSRIISKPVEEKVRLREERVYVKRNPVNRTASAADLDNFKEGEVVIKEHAEKAVVAKEANVVEEVSVGKKVEGHEETIRETVRKTEVDVEQIKGDVTTDAKKAVNNPPYPAK
ncbi:DUF2382 domain-containing protein [Persicitalea sp.]|uniref:DUF2382 domain-containing protein n=1 Tax=Persicitalea sp. TaxID=3100273 RepID=UPI0035932591